MLDAPSPSSFAPVELGNTAPASVSRAQSHSLVFGCVHSRGTVMTPKHAAALPVPQEERKDHQTTEKQGNEVRGKRIATQFHVLSFCDVCVCVCQ